MKENKLVGEDEVYGVFLQSYDGDPMPMWVWGPGKVNEPFRGTVEEARVLRNRMEERNPKGDYVVQPFHHPTYNCVGWKGTGTKWTKDEMRPYRLFRAAESEYRTQNRYVSGFLGDNDDVISAAQAVYNAGYEAAANGYPVSCKGTTWIPWRRNVSDLVTDIRGTLAAEDIKELIERLNVG
jgi:hypothetical protein